MAGNDEEYLDELLSSLVSSNIENDVDIKKQKTSYLSEDSQISDEINEAEIDLSVGNELNIEDLTTEENEPDGMVMTDELVMEELQSDDLVIEKSQSDDLVMEEPHLEEIVLEEQNAEDSVTDESINIETSSDVNNGEANGQSEMSGQDDDLSVEDLLNEINSGILNAEETEMPDVNETFADDKKNNDKGLMDALGDLEKSVNEALNDEIPDIDKIINQNIEEETLSETDKAEGKKKEKNRRKQKKNKVKKEINDNKDNKDNKEKKGLFSFFKSSKRNSENEDADSEDSDLKNSEKDNILEKDSQDLLDELFSDNPDQQMVMSEDVLNIDNVDAFDNPETASLDIPEVNQESKPTEEENKKKKEKKKKEKRPKKKKEKKKKEKKPKKEKEPPKPSDFVKVTPITFIGIAVFTAIIVAALLISSNVITYNRNISQARKHFENGKFGAAYDQIVGMKMKEEDQEFGYQLRAVMCIYKDYVSYENYLNAGMVVEGLDCLIKSFNDYDEFVDDAYKYGVLKQFEDVKELITATLLEYGIDENQARTYLQIENKEQYFEILKNIGGIKE